MKKLYLSLAVLFLMVSSLTAQVNTEWIQRYSGPYPYFKFDEARAITVDNSGNIYVTGRSEGNGTLSDYGTVKYKPSGEIQWIQRYNNPEGTFYDEANAIAVDDAGNVYVTGYSAGSNTGHDYATVKYSPSGVQQWVQRYDGAGNGGGDDALSVAVDVSGNVYVTGYSVGTDFSADFATVKYNSSGVQQWVQRYNGPTSETDLAWSLALDASANVYVTGGSFGNGTNYDITTIKYNSSGAQQWIQRFNGSQNAEDFGYSIAVDASENAYVTGFSKGTGTGNDIATIKYSSSGIQEWIQIYNGPGNLNDQANSIALDGPGNVYVTGGSYGSGSSSDYTTIKYNSSGVQQWLQRFNGPGNSFDQAHSVAVDVSGNVYITGDCFGNGTGSDYATIKYNSSGVQQWLQMYNSPSNGTDYANAIAVNGSGDVYVTGRGVALQTSSGYDYVTIKYSSLTGIQPVVNQIPDEFNLYQNYPNPFNPATNIKFAIPKASYVKLSIYDIIGREVETLVNESIAPGTYEVKWNAAKVSSGIYFYKLITNDFTSVKKMSVIK